MFSHYSQRSSSRSARRHSSLLPRNWSQVRSPDRFWYEYEEEGPPYYQVTTLIVTQGGTRGAQVEALRQWYPPGLPFGQKEGVWWPPKSGVFKSWSPEKAHAFHQALVHAGVFSLPFFRYNKAEKLHVKLEMTFDGKYMWTAFGDRDSATALAFHRRVSQLAKQFGLRDGEKIYTSKNSERLILH
ncbi:MAG TPA: hypothetical protein VF878_03375 [Candidatus Udaeobacter sp.]